MFDALARTKTAAGAPGALGHRHEQHEQDGEDHGGAQHRLQHQGTLRAHAPALKRRNGQPPRARSEERLIAAQPSVASRYVATNRFTIMYIGHGLLQFN
jgi:hypothetical protein